MQIKLYKKGSRNQMVCVRSNGTSEIVPLGPTVPYHDIAHFVIEKTLALKKGFYGNINSGYTVEQLSDKEVINTLSDETLFSEIATRALQSLTKNACSLEQFPELVRAELDQFNVSFRKELPSDLIQRMSIEYQGLTKQWRELKDGETFEMIF